MSLWIGNSLPESWRDPSTKILDLWENQPWKPTREINLEPYGWRILKKP